ncbi:MAG: DUF2812 domain-containing protein [Lachnospiraceae bacterium]|nr:DUF2812 domain-containing protein [Lachnospiraceae bacterium]
MGQKTTKRLFRFWTIADFEAEEEFLREQHKQGWKFVKYTLPGFYTFEASTPEDVIYQLDFTDTKCKATPAYLQMFADYGWEYLLTVNGFNYFRKPAVAHAPEDLTIFSDPQSKIDMIQKITCRRLLPILVILLCCIIPQLSIQSQYDDLASRILYGVFIILFIVYIVLIMHISVTLAKLRKKYQKD